MSRINEVFSDKALQGKIRPYVIAEACINHEGEYAIAEKMVYMAHAMGVDCIKFQFHVLENEMLRETPQSENFKESLWEALERTNLSIESHKKLKKLCDELGIDYLCTPFSRDAADILDSELNATFYKIGSGELTNLPLIEHVAKKNKPIIISTGMSTLEEIEETVNLVKEIGTPFVLTHCVSAYPTPYEIVNLGMIPKMREMFNVPVGLSDHTSDIYTCLGAAALGACVLEKHFTFNKMQKGPDHTSSIEPYEMGELVKGSSAIYLAMGSERKIFDQEKQIVAWARESVVSEVDIAKGTMITEEMVWVKRPSPGEGVVPAKDLKCVIGKVAQVDIKKDKQIRWDDIQ